MKVLVCGGRTYGIELDDKPMSQVWSELFHMRWYLYFLRSCDTVIHGGARGADINAGVIAKSHGCAVVVVKAEWDKYGKRAGHLRNTAMLAHKPDLVVAFPGGAGTADMVRQATEAGCNVRDLR